ncbi:hypothetical protein TIFTF001_035099 [Ficus carica]|uniref:Uncharacterized protein n=1 Tax=Ficus carica TaxID=3494 RepID=A0AA88JBC7_FICCA|nr:hypothetical protein TIFTF001_035099 [Ficus carica]
MQPIDGSSVPHRSSSPSLLAHLVLPCCSFVCPSSFPCAFGLFSSVEARSRFSGYWNRIYSIPYAPAVCSTLRIPELFALLFTTNNISISSFGLNPEYWLMASPESCRDFKIPNSLILFLGFLPPGLIFDSSRGTWAPAGSVHRTPGLGTADGKCGADWGPRRRSYYPLFPSTEIISMSHCFLP